MLSQQVTKKKKKVKSNKERRPPSQKARVLARPNQPLGTSFEYDHSVRAMCVTEFVSPDSVVCKSGVKPGMHLTEVDDLSVVGLKQDDVVFMLQRKAGDLRELLFERLQQPTITVNDKTALRTQSASSSKVPSVVTDEKEDTSPSKMQQLPQLTSPTTSNSPLRHTIRKLQSTPSPSALSSTSPSSSISSSSSPENSTAQAPRHRKSQELHKAISSASQTSYVHMMKQGVSPATSTTARGHPYSTVTSSQPGASTFSASSSSRSDPFSTPARRRRLVADVARFLLKQYCTQACSLVHIARVRNKSATIIQCLFRCYKARRLFRNMMFEKHNAAATQIQALCRMLAAKETLRKLQKEHRHKVATHLALCLQCLSRVRSSHTLVAKVKHENTRVALGVQRLVRGCQGRRRALQRRRHLEKLQSAKERAATRVQSQLRRRVAQRVLVQMRKIYELEMSMSFRIALHWRRRCRRRRLAAIIIQRLQRGRQGRRIAAAAALRRLEEKRRALDERLMSLEDHRAGLLRAQHRVEIRVDLSPSLLSSLKRCKIATLIKWCVEQSVLKYEDNDRGSYAMGEVIKQVLRATHSPSKASSHSRSLHAKHAPLEKQNSIDIKQSGDEKQAILLPSSGEGFPSQFNKRYTGLPNMLASAVSASTKNVEGADMGTGRPLTLRISPTEEGGGCVHMHLEPVFLSFAAESDRLRRQQLIRGKGAPMDDPLSCPNLSSCDVHIILGADTSDMDINATSGISERYKGVGGEGERGDGQLSPHTQSDEEEMLKFRFKDVSVSVSVTTIVSGDDTTECLVNTKKKREEEERARLEEERVKAKELADLEATKALVAEINAAMAEAERAQREEAEKIAKRLADEEAAAAAAAAAAAKLKAANAGKRSRPTTATKRIKVSIIDEDEREKELLRKRLAEEEAERQRRLEAERLAAEKIRLARLQAIRENAAASCIQKHHRAALLRQLRNNAVRILQACAKRKRLLSRWWSAVGLVLRAKNLVVVSLQSRFRGHMARELVLQKRLDACSNASLQEADHWMNVLILDDFRFALGRSYISEGKKGYIIGGRNGDDDSQLMDGQSAVEEESVVEEKEESSEDDSGDDSDDESEDEEDYIINQRLNKNKVTKNTVADMENFVNRLFAVDDAKVGVSDDARPDGPPSVVCCSSLEDLTALGAPVSLQGSGKWAAQLMHLTEFLPPPPCCVKPLEVLVRIPLPPPAPEPGAPIKQAVPGRSSDGNGSSSSNSKKSSTDDSKAEERSLGDLSLLSEPHLVPAVKSTNFAQLSSPPEVVPAVYTMGARSSS